MSGYEEKRRDVRVALQTPMELKWRTEDRTGSGTISNMSQSGCYVMTRNPLPAFEQIFVQIGELPELECLVRYVDPQVGMGLQFVGVKLEAQQKINEFLKAKAVLWAPR